MLNVELRAYILNMYRGLATSVAECRSRIQFELEKLEQ